MRKLILRAIQYATVSLVLALIGIAVYSCVLRYQELQEATR